MKIRVCQLCKTDIHVPNNSARKICDGCYPEYNRAKSNAHYKRCIENGKVHEYRKRASEHLKLKKDSDHQYRMWAGAKGRASKSGLEFNIDKEDIIIPDICPVLKTPFERNTYYTMSLDRIDSSKGYIKGNVQVLSFKANVMKNSASKEELIKFAEWILNEG